MIELNWSSITSRVAFYWKVTAFRLEVLLQERTASGRLRPRRPGSTPTACHGVSLAQTWRGPALTMRRQNMANTRPWSDMTQTRRLIFLPEILVRIPGSVRLRGLRARPCLLNGFGGPTVTDLSVKASSSDGLHADRDCILVSCGATDSVYSDTPFSCSGLAGPWSPAGKANSSRPARGSLSTKNPAHRGAAQVGSSAWDSSTAAGIWVPACTPAAKLTWFLRCCLTTSKPRTLIQEYLDKLFSTTLTRWFAVCVYHTWNLPPW